MFEPKSTTPEKIAKEIFKEFNPDELVPFPFENIFNEEENLRIYHSSKMKPDISGVILHFADEGYYCKF